MQLTSGKGPYAFIVPATQRDQFATYEMLEILEFADVEIHRATSAFRRQRQAVSGRVVCDQDRAALRRVRQDHAREAGVSDLRIFPGGPPEPPYDVTGHTLWMLMGVTVDQRTRRSTRRSSA